MESGRLDGRLPSEQRAVRFELDWLPRLLPVISVDRSVDASPDVCLILCQQFKRVKDAIRALIYLLAESSEEGTSLEMELVSQRLILFKQLLSSETHEWEESVERRALEIRLLDEQGCSNELIFLGHPLILPFLRSEEFDEVSLIDSSRKEAHELE